MIEKKTRKPTGSDPTGRGVCKKKIENKTMNPKFQSTNS